MVAESMAPYWRDSLLRQFGRLDRDIRVDVAIVGGGITGITAAYLLKMAGRTAALLERGRCAQIDTGHTTAHLTCVTDTPLSSLVNEYGADHARAVWDAGFAAMAQIDGHIRSERIACDFEWVPGYLHAPAADGTSGAADTLREEAELAYRLGFDARYLERVPYMDQPGIEYGGQARFHPRKYLAALLERLDGDGSYVFEQTAVDQVRDEPLAAVANGHTVTCEHIVLATHNPLVGKSGLASASLLQTKLSLYTSYAVGGRISPGGIPDALFWDTADPYRYLRLEPHEGFDYVIFGGEDHKTGQQDDTRLCFERLEAALSRVVPGVDVTHRWSGQVIETSDGLPFIGETAARQFIATGFAGNGMTFGTLGAMMACDAVLGRRNPWRELFDLRRPAIRAGLWDYLAENKDYPYYLIRDRFTGPDGRTLRALRRGEGKVLELDGERVAAYRAVDGSVTLRSPICTHLSCVVHWNAAEKTWDCPCHGSRFSPDGRVISGPAERPLQEASRDPLP